MFRHAHISGFQFGCPFRAGSGTSRLAEGAEHGGIKELLRGYDE